MRSIFRFILILISTHYVSLLVDASSLMDCLPLVGSGNQDDVELILLNDGSGSISSTDWGAMLSINKLLIEKLNANVRLSVLIFSSGVREVFPLTFLDGAQPRLTQILTEQFKQPSGSTGTDKALLKALDMFSVTAAKFVIILTDGEPNSRGSFLEATKKLKAQGVSIKSITFSASDSAITSLEEGSEHVYSARDMKNLLHAFDSLFAKPQCDKLEVELVPVLSVYRFLDSATFTIHFDSSRLLKKPPIVVNGLQLFVEEVARSDGRRHFKSFAYEIENAQGHKTKVPVELETRTGAEVATLPEMLKWELKNQDNLVCGGHFKLESHLFTGDLRDALKASNQGQLNMIIMGFKGHGKTLSMRLLLTSLGKIREKSPVGVVGSGDEHTTLSLNNYPANELLGEKDLKINIVDTVGINNTNYKDGYLAAILDGKVPEGHAEIENLTRFNTEMLSLKKVDSSRVIHCVIFVVSVRVKELTKDDENLQNALKQIHTLKGYRHNPVVLVTHWDEVPQVDKTQATLREVMNKLSLSGVAYPVSGYPENPYRVFETDIQMLNALAQATRTADAWTKLNMKDEL